MADLSKIKAPDGTEVDIKDATARSGLADKMDKADPTGTGTLSMNRKSGTTVGSYSTALGYNGTASGNYSTSLGNRTKATGAESVAEGYSSTASGSDSHAEGYSTTASGASAHSEGSGTSASGQQSHAEGSSCTAAGKYSHAEGKSSSTGSNAQSAHAECENNQANGKYSHAEGYYTIASGQSSHAEGEGSSSTKVTASGKASHAEGYFTTASGDYGSHSEGWETTASGAYSHSEGGKTVASGDGAHAEGKARNIGTEESPVYKGKATGIASHSEGYGCDATNLGAHAEGGNTTASGSASHAEGDGTIAASNNQHVSGMYNIEDTNNTYAEIIGNGSSSDRSNARTLDWSGNEWIAGGFKCNGMEASSSAVKLINPEKWRDAIFDCTPDGSAKDRLLSRLTKGSANIKVYEYGGYFGGSQQKRLKLNFQSSSYGKYQVFIHMESNLTQVDYQMFLAQNSAGTAFERAAYGKTTPSWTNMAGTAATGGLTWTANGLQIFSSVFDPYGGWYVKIIAHDGSTTEIPNVYYTNES